MGKLSLGLLAAAVVVLLGWLFRDPIEQRLPNPIYAIIAGRPAVSPDVPYLIDAGAGLRSTYRDKWLADRPAESTLPDGALRLCVEPADGCDFASLADAFAALEPGGVLVIGPGIYEEAASLGADSVRIVAEPGAHVRGHAVEGKAALVVTGDDVVIEGLECSGIAVGDGNGACVRFEGRNLTLRGVYFHDSQEGLLTRPGSGLVLIEDSVFERLGEGGQAHAVYMNGGPGTELVVRRTHVLASKGQGHGVKSRAARTTVEDSVVASLDGEDSRLIDIPEGGIVTIRRNILENGPNSSNADMIAIGLELDGPVSDRDLHRTSIVANLMLLDRYSNVVLHRENVPFAELTNNVIVGGSHRAVDAANYWFLDRHAAGLPEFPRLID